MRRRILAAILWALWPSLALGATAYQNLVAASSPCTYWYMDATSGTTETNHGSATSQDGTYVNTPTLNQTGIPGNPGSPSVKFTAASTQKMTWSGTGGGACPITGTYIPTCNLGTPINATIIAWVKPTDLAANAIIASSSGSTHWTFELVRLTSGKAVAAMYQDGGAVYLQAVGAIAGCSAGAWCMEALKFTASGTTLSAYMNGALDTSVNTPSGTCGGQQPAALPSVGGRGDGLASANDTIDEVAWFDQSLSDATILGFYNAGIAPPSGVQRYRIFQSMMPFREDALARLERERRYIPRALLDALPDPVALLAKGRW